REKSTPWGYDQCACDADLSRRRGHLRWPGWFVRHPWHLLKHPCQPEYRIPPRCHGRAEESDCAVRTKVRICQVSAVISAYRKYPWRLPAFIRAIFAPGREHAIGAFTSPRQQGNLAGFSAAVT